MKAHMGRRRGVAVAGLLLAVAVTLIACGAPDPRLAPGAKPAGAILFVAGGNVYRWDGDVEQVTRDVHAASPRWAPDGARFAYVQVFDDLGYSELVIAGRDGQVLGQVTANRPDAQPGSHLFARYAYWAMDPAWSPAGDQLAFVSDRGGWEPAPDEERYSDPMYLWYAESLEAPPYLLRASARLGLTQEWPTFSPDGGRLAFAAREEGDRRITGIWTMDLNSGETAPLVEAPDGAFAPAWSPSGKQIAYVQRDGAQHDIWVAPLDGAAPYKLTDVGTATAPAWSPDGRFLAFFCLNDGQFEARAVAVTPGADGRLIASQPRTLFSVDEIDVTSGMSWAANS